ncbi:MAG: ABC transporter ATP-binding protein, partial [Bacteroidetes bacterium]|nr:ABC transporter ATP-binding protein [Bacteroidota bacterium]
MKSIWRILKLCRPYTGYAVLNIFFNLLMSLFFLGSFTLFIPVLQMLFKTVPAVTTPPESLNLLDIDSIKDNFYYIIGSQISKYGEVEVLIGICVIIIVVFLLKNLFRFLAMFFLAVVRIGVVRDFRNNLYEKITILPLGYYSEQRKGDILARISSDVLEVEHSVMSS